MAAVREGGHGWDPQGLSILKKLLRRDVTIAGITREVAGLDKIPSSLSFLNLTQATCSAFVLWSRAHGTPIPNYNGSATRPVMLRLVLQLVPVGR